MAVLTERICQANAHTGVNWPLRQSPRTALELGAQLAQDKQLLNLPLSTGVLVAGSDPKWGFSRTRDKVSLTVASNKDSHPP